MKDLFAQVAGCFPRRETRQAASQMVNGLLMELEDYNAHAALEIGLIPVTIPEMLRMLRGTIIRPPRRDHAHRQH